MPVGYFLVTFTVPEELRFAFHARPKLLHALLFAAAAAALQQAAATPRHLGGDGARSAKMVTRCAWPEAKRRARRAGAPLAGGSTSNWG